MHGSQVAIGIIGAGPRGVSVLERICANAHRSVLDVPVVVHVIDPHPPGAGKVWRTAQSSLLLMNTVSSQVTLFTDDSVDLEGPVVPGPSLYEWARHMTLFGAVDGYDTRLLPEARELGPDAYPGRAFYGQYLEWVFRRILRNAPEHVTVRVHQARAVRLSDAWGVGCGEGPQTVVLEDGSAIEGLDAVVLSQGHLAVEPSAYEQSLTAFAGEHGLTYVLPSNPADTDLTSIRAGEAVALRGLGLNYFDYQTLLTAGRGGRFERLGDGRLVYRPSGQEPVLYAGSRRGIPYHSRGENQKGAHGRHLPVVLTPQMIEKLNGHTGSGSGVDFRQDLWPLIAKEVEGVYYATLLQTRQCTCDAARFRERYLRCGWRSTEEERLLEEFGIAAGERWDWERVSQPYADRRFTGPDDFCGWLLDYLRNDLEEAKAGNVRSPLKAALDVLRDLRNEIRLIVDYGGLAGRSHKEDLEHWYTPLNAFLSIGPPTKRIEEMVALIEAGVLRILGPAMTVRTGDGVFTVGSPAVPDSTVQVTALIEARLPSTDLRRTSDPLLRDLAATGQCRTYWVHHPDGEDYETGGLAVTSRPHQLIDANGAPHPRRFAFGVPTESVHWVTAAGIRPGVNSVTLSDADAIARALLRITHPTTDQPTTPATTTPATTTTATEGPVGLRTTAVETGIPG